MRFLDCRHWAFSRTVAYAAADSRRADALGLGGTPAYLNLQLKSEKTSLASGMKPSSFFIKQFALKSCLEGADCLIEHVSCKQEKHTGEDAL